MRRDKSTSDQSSPSPRQKFSLRRKSLKWWLIVVLLVALVGIGTFLGVRHFTDKPAATDQAEPAAAEEDKMKDWGDVMFSEETPDEGQIAYYTGTAGLYADAGRLDEALATIRKAEAIDPNSKEVHKAYARFYALVGDTTNRHKHEQQAGFTVPDVSAEKTQEVCAKQQEYTCPAQ